MNQVLVAVFDSEANARKALAALERLADTDVVRVNASAIVTKGPGGAITVSRTEEAAPESTLGATAVGMLVGMLAGGVGLAVGATTGLIVGSMADAFYLKVGRDFLADVEHTLAAGKTALVAQIYEEDTAAVDEQMADLGALVFRRPIGDIADDEYETALSKLKRRINRQHV
jgi:uncharacterized membrane protein